MKFSAILTLIICLFFGSLASAQLPFGEKHLLDARLFVDTLEYSWSENTVTVGGRERLGFRYNEEDEVVEVYVLLDDHTPAQQLRLLPSADFVLVDSLLVFSEYIRFKVRFSNLTTSNFLKFTFELRLDSLHSELIDLPLQPYTKTYVTLYPPTEELFIGEEKVFELTTNNPHNLVIDNRWTQGLPINYRTTRTGDEVFLHVLPNALGDLRLTVPFQVNKPNLVNGRLRNEVEPVVQHFTIKSGRLAFLQFDQKEVTPKDDKIQPIEIQVDNDRLLRLGKTYRIENQEERGGALIAELYTKARLNNDKVLCLLRPYAFHRQSNGYLYIKDGDEPLFVSNLDITPKTTIHNIYIQREGKDFVPGNVVYPGETVNVKLEGEALHKAKFTFPGANNLEFDSLIKNEKISLFRIKVPLTVSSSRIEIFNHNESTGRVLSVSEYQKPRALDFVTLDLGVKQFRLDQIEKPIYFEENLTDLVIDFDRSAIDQGSNLHGKQYITIKVKISNKKGNLIELYQFDQVVICPGIASPRFVHYDDKDCRPEDINLNNFLSKKTSELEEWSRIELEISHMKEKYGGGGRTKRVQIFLKREYNFDIDVSFPAGLLILKRPDEGSTSSFANFGGPSFAMIAQMSFYQPGKIAKYQPYKIGAGFIAMDAFNFASSDNRDVGLVVIGSLYPTSSDNRLSFPLYAGFGVFLVEKKPFFLIGPGIRVRI